MGFEDLRRLIDNSKVETFDFKQIDIGVKRCGGGTDHTRVFQCSRHSVARAALLDFVAKKVCVIRLVARNLRTDTYEIDALLFKFAANFVHRPVGVRQQQYAGVCLKQFLTQDVKQSERRLAGAWRAYHKKQLTGLLRSLHEGVEIAVVALAASAGIDLGHALQQQHIAPPYGCGQETVHPCIKGICRRVKQIVLYRPANAVGLREHAAVCLRIAKCHPDAVYTDIGYRAAFHHPCAGVGLGVFFIRIKHHDVAHPEIRSVGGVSLGKPQRHVGHRRIGKSRCVECEVAIDAA